MNNGRRTALCHEQLRRYHLERTPVPGWVSKSRNMKDMKDMKGTKGMKGAEFGHDSVYRG